MSASDNIDVEAARFSLVEALRTIAELAEDAGATSIEREKAHKALVLQLLRLKQLAKNPDISLDFRSDHEDVLRRFCHS